MSAFFGTARRGVALCLVALAPIGVLAVTSIELASHQVTHVVNQQVETTAAVSSVVIGQETVNLVNLVHSYATRLSFGIALSGGAGNDTTLAQNLKSLASSTPGISASFVTNMAGTSLATYPHFASAIGQNFAYRDWYKGLIATGRPYVSSAIETQETGRPLAITVTDYIRGPSGHPVGILGVNYSLQAITSFAAKAGRAQGITLQVTDQDGTSLTAVSRSGLVSLAADPRVQAALAGRSGLLTYSPVLAGGGRGRAELSAYSPVTDTGWTVVASKDRDAAFAGLVRLRDTVLAITTLLVLILLAGVVAILRSDRRRRDSERLVQRRDRELAGLLDSTDEGFISISGQGVITGWNSQAVKIYGWSEPEVVGRQALEVMIAARHRQTCVDDFASYRGGTGSTLLGKRVEMTARHRDGREITLELGLWAHEDGDGFSAFVRDITERVTTQRALETERRRLTEAQELGRIGSFECDIATNTWAYTTQMSALWGLDHRQLSPDAMLPLIIEADRDRIWDAWQTARRGGGRYVEEYSIRRASDGQERVVRATLDVELGPDGHPLRAAGTHLDITDVAVAEKAAERANAFFDAVLAASPDFTFVSNLATGDLVYTSRDRDILGVEGTTIQSLGQAGRASLIHPDDRHRVEAVNTAAADLEDGEVLQLRHRAQHTDGQWHWLSRRITPFRRDSSGAVVEILGVVRDVSDVMESEQRLTHAALHDSLTGLPNRALLMDRLEAALARSARDGREVAVLFCDLDGFKRVNDVAGHGAGDTLLLEVAQRLRTVLREHDTVARVGGDEFVIIVEPWDRADSGDHAKTPDQAKAADRLLAVDVAERVSAALQQPVKVKQIDHVVSASIGITYATLSPGQQAGSLTAEQVLQNADAAMYVAKARGKDRFEVFEHGQHTDAAERGRVERLLWQALSPPAPSLTPDAKWPTCNAVYQPIFGSETGTLVSFEALARLTDTDGDPVPPDVFIPIAEETGSIHRLGRAMLGLACGQLRAWRTEIPGLEDVTVAVNLSALQAQHASLVDDVHDALAAHDLAPRDLVLELTETALLQVANSTMNALRLLRAEGVGIAIDDFGTGYASLRYLATLPVSAVKIDRSFTAGLPHDETSRKIVKAVAGLAADMDLTCTIEGIETAEQRAAVPSGVHLQGFLTGRPQQPERMDLLTLCAQGAPG